MDDKAKHSARCGQYATTKLQFTDLEIKVERMQAQEILLGCLQCFKR
jgi:hypothetical protein